MNSGLCPTCKIALVPRAIDSIQIDECTRCRYAWVDPEEVAAARRVFPPSDRGGLPQFVLATSGSTLACPRCNRLALQLGSIGTRIAHRCSDCGGFWVPLHGGPVVDSGADLLLQVCVDLLLSALPP